MKVDVLGLYLHEAMLLTLGEAAGVGLWASLGRREIGLCQLFAAAYPARRIQHVTAKNWGSFASSNEDPGSYLLNLGHETAIDVLNFAAAKKTYCFVGLYDADYYNLKNLAANLPENSHFFNLHSTHQFSEPLMLLSSRKPVRLVISIETEALGQTGSLLGISL